jgi:flagellar hook assembly protein FlgD
MPRHPSRPPRAAKAALAAVLFTVGAWLAPAARAQNVNLFIQTIFAATSLPTGGDGGGGSFCAVTTGGGNVTQFFCPVGFQPLSGPFYPWPQTFGDISNLPEINFANNYDQGLFANRCIGDPTSSNPLAVNTASGLAAGTNLSLIYPSGANGFNICNSQVYVCTQVCGIGASTSTPLAVDSIEFDIFRYVDGANPLDATSTPPLRTFFIDNPGTITNNPLDSTSNCVPQGNPTFPGNANGALAASCILWDGSQAVQGTFGKINGSYGVRVTALTNQQGQSGNIQITNVKAFPGTPAETYDTNANTVAQQPIIVNVTDVHVINSTPTVVGKITGVAAEPYNFTYRLSKPATMYITINAGVPDSGGNFVNLRNLLGTTGEQEPGEGNLGTTGSTPLLDGSSWDGRDNNAQILPPGTYLAVFQGNSVNPYISPFYGPMQGDLSSPTTYTIALDPLQITDIQISPLLGGTTSLAVMSYMLTEPATVYVDIYPPNTQFCNDSTGNPAIQDMNSTATDPDTAGQTPPPAKNLYASLGACPQTPATAVTPVRTIQQFQQSRSTIIAFWDGRNTAGTYMNDGDYVFAIYGSLPSQRGVAYNGNTGDTRIWTSTAKTGFISIVRGLVGVTQISPTSTVIGSSPAVAGLNPFSFSYQISRPATVTLQIYDQTGLNLIATVLEPSAEPGQVTISNVWNGVGDNGAYNGLIVSSGTYLAQLTVFDPAFPAKVSTTTVLFPVNMFRVTDVNTTPLLAVANDTATLTYQLSQPMFIAWNIYPPGTVVLNPQTNWPPCPNLNPPGPCTDTSLTSVVNSTGGLVSPVITYYGFRPGRLKITESWDGETSNGISLPDGAYVYTLTTVSSGTPVYYPIDHVYGTVTVARGSVLFNSFNVNPTIPTLFNSSSTITLDPYSIQYSVSRISSVTISILTTTLPQTTLATVIAGGVRQPAILNTDVWDGRDNNGNFLPVPITGGGTAYIIQAVAQDISASSVIPSTAQVTASYDPLRIYDLAVTPIVGGGSAIIAYQVSEPMKVSLKIYQPNTSFDASGNPSPPDSVSLVKVITGVRPSRTNIKDTWDGTNMTGTIVPEGDYKFRLVASTDTNAIDTQTGNVLLPSELADDRLIDDIPVTLGPSANPSGDLNSNSYVYPNPVPASAASATFQVWNPFPHAHITLKLYTMSGHLVFGQDFGTGLPPSYQSGLPGSMNANGVYTYVWNKSNASGRGVARGIYYAVIRVEQEQEGTTVLQVVKKALLQ